MRKHTPNSLLRVASHLAVAFALTGVCAGAALAQDSGYRETRFGQYTDRSTAQTARGARGSSRTTRAGYERVTNRPGELTAAADYMPIGRVVLAPTGFLEMCARSPSDCIHASRYSAEEIRGEARRMLVRKYDIAFGRAPAEDDIQTASIASTDIKPAAIDDTVIYLRWNGQNRPLLAPAQILTTGVDTRSLLAAPQDAGRIAPVSRMPGDMQPGAISDGPVRYLSWGTKAISGMPAETVAAAPDLNAQPIVAPAEAPVVSLERAPYDRRTYRSSLVIPAVAQPASTPVSTSARSDSADYDRLSLDDTTMRVIRVINNDVNRTVRSETDASIYHKADYWAAPGLMRGARGDCEDFALEKRRQLIENGIPAGALSIATVITRRGDEHAVLLVSTTEGELVLDNLQYDVKSWRRTDYVWVSRQAPGQTLDWVSLSPANGTPSDRQLRTTRVAYAR